MAYVDDLLAAVDMEGMRAHLGRCSACARQDTAVRRSLLLVHNLPPIEPSPDFMLRLNARLADIGPPSRHVVARRSLFFSMPAVGTFAAVAAGIGVVAVLSFKTTHTVAPTATPSVATADLAAQITNAPIPPFDSLPLVSSFAGAGPDVAPLANEAYVAAVPTGIPIWPAVLMVGEAPVRLATMELRQSERR